MTLLSSSSVEGCTTAAATLTINIQVKRTTATKLKCRWVHVNVHFQCQHDAEHCCLTVKVVLLSCCSTDKEEQPNYILRKSIQQGKLQSNTNTAKTPDNGSLLARKLLLAADSWSIVSNKMCFGPNIGVVLLTPLTWSIHLALIGCPIYSANIGSLLLFIFFFFFFISTYQLSSDDNLLRAIHVWAKTSLFHVPVIVYSSISNFRGENGVGLERQLLINLQKFKVKKGIKKAKSSVALHADCFCVCLLKCDWSILVRLEKQATNKKRNASNTIPMQIRLYMLRDSRRIQ